MKTKTKRILSFVLAIMVLMSVVPTMNVSAASTIAKGTCGENLTWKLTEKGTLTVSGSGKMSDFESVFKTPWSKQRHKIKKIVIKDGVESIGNHAFDGAVNLTKVNIADSIQTIGKKAFQRCHDLEKLVLPDGITSIGKYAFSSCESLKEIKLPKNIKTVSYKMLSGCKNLTEIVIPYGVKKIDDQAFYGCKKLKNIVIPNSVNTIGKNIFQGSENLKTVNIPASVTTISPLAFGYFNNIENINVDSNNLNFSSDNGVLFNKDKTEIIRFASGRKENSYVIPNKVKTIGAYAFMNCENLNNITIPESVTRINKGAFESTGLTALTIPESVKVLDEEAFMFLQVSELKLPSGIKSISKGLFEGSRIESIEIPNGVATIGKNAFRWCSELKKVTIPASVKKIEKCAFSDCMGIEETHIKDLAAWCEINFLNDEANPLFRSKKLYLNGRLVTDIVIPEGVTQIGDYAFNGYRGNNLKSLKLPSTLKSIGHFAFGGLSGIKSVDIPYGVTEIGDYAFSSCYSLEKVTIPSSVKKIGVYSFGGTGLVSVKIPNGVKEIGEYAFNCNNLKSVSIPESVTKIENNTFSSSPKLEKIKVDSKNKNYKSVKGVLFNKKMTQLIQYPAAKSDTSYTIPDSVTKIKDNAFEHCINLETVKIPNTVKTIGNYSFFACEKIKSIKLPDSVKTIGRDAFFRCYELKSVRLSKNIKVIPENAFGSCYALSEIKFPSKLVSIGEGAFAGCKSLKKVKFPITLTEISFDAFANCQKLKTYEIPASVTNLSDSFIGRYYKGEYGEYTYKNVKIKGYKGSAAEKYAKANGIEFVKLKSHSHNYSGKRTVPATIKLSGGICDVCSVCGKAKVKTKIAKIKSVKLSKTKFTYNGEKQRPTVTVKDSNGKKLKKDTDYTVKYSTGCTKVGQYEVTVTFKGKYEGKKILTFNIVPKGVSFSKVTAGTEQFTAAWKKQTAQISGYEIQYSTSKKMKGEVTTLKVGRSEVAKTVTKLTRKTTYYVRVRTYKTFELSDYKDETYYSSWSEVKSVKVK